MEKAQIFWTSSGVCYWYPRSKPHDNSHFKGNFYLFLATKFGYVKRIPFSEFRKIKGSSFSMMKVRYPDVIRVLKVTDGEQKITLKTKDGMKIKFSEKDIKSGSFRQTSRRGIYLHPGDEVVTNLKERIIWTR